MHELSEKLRQMIQGEHRVRLIILLGIAGMGLILLSGIVPKKTAQPQQPEAPPADAAAAPDQYREEMEARLTALLSRMDGVGQVTVMLTVSGSAEQIYAEEVKDAHSPNNTQRSSAPVITRAGGSESALLTEIRYPAIQGAAILCTNGDHAAVQERVTSAAAALLDIPVKQIYVGKCTGTFTD